ncbi:hypothetical protein L204_101003 [Cryptococcus depauperatus]|nr:tRNA (guanine-N(1)-)-methyltransferase [Cryptococcus depauperatus CBS 7855]
MEIDEMGSVNGESSTTSQATGQSSTGRPEGVSKKAIKRAARQARMEAVKPLKRAAEKERRRQRTAQLAEGYAAGTLCIEDKELVERRRRVERERKEAKKRIDDGDQENDWPGGVVIDLGFDRLMTDQEIASMSQQLGYLYSSNRTAQTPVRTVIHTSFSPSASPRLWKRMKTFNWQKWSRCYWWGEGLENLSHQLGECSSADSVKAGLSERVLPNLQENYDESESLLFHLTGPQLPADLQSRNFKLVYLSADADEELNTLSKDEVYIIGGIVDRNRYKRLCQEKADTLGVRTARLPIGSYLANLPTRKVLTVNQVFDILVQYLSLNDWQAAFEAVIPIRKYVANYRKAKKDARQQSEQMDDAAKDDDRDVVWARDEEEAINL